MPDEVSTLMAELILTADDVSRLLRVPVDTVKNLTRTEQLKSVKCGKHRRYLPEHVREFREGLLRG